MNFPAYTCHPVAVTAEMEQAIGVKPLEAYLDRDLLLVLENADAVRNLQPDFAKLSQLNGVCIAVTARDTDMTVFPVYLLQRWAFQKIR